MKGKMKNINIKAVVVGVLADILGTIFAVGLIMILIWIVLYGDGIQGDALIQHTEKLMQSTNFLAGVMVFGTFMDFVAGFITGKIAKKSEVTNAGLVGGISVLLGLIMSIFSPSSTPTWFNWSAYLITIPAVILGGMFSSKFQNSLFLSINLKGRLWVLNCVIIFCFYKAAQLIGWAYFTNSEIISSLIEALLWLITAVGLIKKINVARIAMIVWLVIEIVLGVPYQLSHLSGKIQAHQVFSIVFYILIRAFVIYYLQRKAVISKFKKNVPDAVPENG